MQPSEMYNEGKGEWLFYDTRMVYQTLSPLIVNIVCEVLSFFFCGCSFVRCSFFGCAEVLEFLFLRCKFSERKGW